MKELWTGRSINFTSLAADDWTTNEGFVLSAALLVLALAYLLYTRLRGTRVSLRILSGVFLAGWLSLDLVWQYRLSEQLLITRDIFAHLPIEERTHAARHGPLADFANAVRLRAKGDRTQRVFIANTVDYAGVRVAYHLYPMNVYWHRWRPQLPAPRHYRSGDLIVLLSPSRIKVDPSGRALILPSGKTVPVEPVMQWRVGRLYRVP